jgi:hypothetical protein
VAVIIMESTMKVPHRKTLQSVLLIVVLIAVSTLAGPALAQDSFSINVEIDDITPPESCSSSYWAINFVRRTTISGAHLSTDLTRYPSAVMSYVVQYVDGDVNLVDYWGSGYSAYVQDYMVPSQTDNFASARGSYAIPLWSDTYEAVTVEYLLYQDRVVWEIRASLECDGGDVAAYDIISQAAEGDRADLPKPGRNLVLALDDIPRYRDPFKETGYLGTIRACQTFYISDIYMPRASISTWARESITGQNMLIGGGPPPRPLIVDVHEDYGQPGGQPIVDACTGA